MKSNKTYKTYNELHPIAQGTVQKILYGSAMKDHKHFQIGDEVKVVGTRGKTAHVAAHLPEVIGVRLNKPLLNFYCWHCDDLELVAAASGKKIKDDTTERRGEGTTRKTRSDKGSKRSRTA